MAEGGPAEDPVEPGEIEYLIKWKGWPAKYNTWEPMAHLQNLQQEIEAFIPRQFWQLAARVRLPPADGHAPASSASASSAASTSASLQWTRNPCFDQRQARRAAMAVEAAGKLLVASTAVAKRSYPPPVGMNTVALLKLASSALPPNPYPNPTPSPDPNPNHRGRRARPLPAARDAG